MKHKVMFTPTAWNQYASWSRKPRMLTRIDRLIRDIDRDPAGEGIGKPELLRGFLSGWASRRIDGEHRLVYRVRDEVIEIAWCYGHYDD